MDRWISMRRCRGAAVARRGFALLLGAMALLAGPVVGAKSIGAFNAATFNLRFNTPADGLDAWPHREAAVKALIRFHEFDLVGTQEGRIEQVQALQRMPGWARVGVGRDDGKQGGEHAAIFFRTARFERLGHGDFWLSATPDKPSISWDSPCCHRIASWAQLRDRESGGEFFVFNVHFDHEGVVARRESARLLVRKVADIAGSAPVIVLGDFNATPDAEPIGTMTAVFRDAVRISEAPPYGPEGTFNGFRFDAPAQKRIDYIFLSPGWRVLRLGVLTDSLRGRFPSDHFPVVARLQQEGEHAR